MEIRFTAAEEAQPGPVWAGLFAGYWPAYHRWWASRGLLERPTYRESRRALQAHMPEILPLYDELCELAGGKDSQARFLSFFCPPPYPAACSQAVWRGSHPLLVRNYDYRPESFDALLLHTTWQGRQVIGMADGMFGLLDGMNDAGLALSLTFGGRRGVVEGFGIPLILRYILQTCDTLEGAAQALRRIPCHMAYNVTVIDRAGNHFTASLGPGESTVITGTPYATNHQNGRDSASPRLLSASIERERFLLARMTGAPTSMEQFTALFLRPPLRSMVLTMGFPTLYTAAYRPDIGRMQLRWPHLVWEHAFDAFDAGERVVSLPQVLPAAGWLGS